MLHITSVWLYSCLGSSACKMHAPYILSSVVCLAAPYCFTFFHEQHVFLKRNLLNVICVFGFLYKLAWKSSQSNKKLSDVWSKVYIGLHVKYTPFLSHFNEAWIFSTDFRKLIKCQIELQSVTGSRVVPCGQTERGMNRNDEGNNCSLLFCERSQK